MTASLIPEDASIAEIGPNSLLVALEVPKAHIVTLQAFIESYEGIGIVRTMKSEQNIIGILTTPDMVAFTLEVLNDISAEVPWRFLEAFPQEIAEAYLTELSPQAESSLRGTPANK